MKMFTTYFAIYSLAAATAIGFVEGHGWSTISRAIKCKENLNANCGDIIYEPQSLEALKGFPNGGPPDGQIASAGTAPLGNSKFMPLNEQTSSRWHKTSVAPGPLTFNWRFTVNHKTTRFEYYMTKTGWNPNSVLTRAQFDLTPFCSVPFGGAQPNIGGISHGCTLPAKSGYHVILAVWVIDDTANAFYNVIDVQYSGSTIPAPAPAPTTAKLGDWAFCSSNSECANGCCSLAYSNDGKLKCTPLSGGFNPSICTGTTTKLGDWAFCSTSLQCANGCCSRTYSNDGQLKCTPLNGGYNPSICV